MTFVPVSVKFIHRNLLRYVIVIHTQRVVNIFRLNEDMLGEFPLFLSPRLMMFKQKEGQE